MAETEQPTKASPIQVIAGVILLLLGAGGGYGGHQLATSSPSRDEYVALVARVDLNADEIKSVDTRTQALERSAEGNAQWRAGVDRKLDELVVSIERLRTSVEQLAVRRTR